MVDPTDPESRFGGRKGLEECVSRKRSELSGRNGKSFGDSRFGKVDDPIRWIESLAKTTTASVVEDPTRTKRGFTARIP